MTFDEQHGWVERGTAGHHASAQGVDVGAEVAALDRIHARPPYDMEYAAFRYEKVRDEDHTALFVRWRYPTRCLPHAGFDVGQDSATAVTTYAVEGDTLRIVHTARLLVRAQTVNVTMTIGGE